MISGGFGSLMKCYEEKNRANRGKSLQSAHRQSSGLVRWWSEEVTGGVSVVIGCLGSLVKDLASLALNLMVVVLWKDLSVFVYLKTWGLSRCGVYTMHGGCAFAGLMSRSIRQLKPVERKRGLRRLFETKLNIKEESEPKLEGKENMDLDENSYSGNVKQGKTEIYTPRDDKRDPLPGAELHMVYLTGKPIEGNGASLAYHEKFLEKVFGRHAAKIIIVYSYSRIEKSFGVWLTDEEVDVLAGQDEVDYAENGDYHYEILY
ncbi:uncharacterized protein LOC131314145 [Rhododendron vialii]|uniref:uncharacterized protein LOC131314145 n=1 Tax=Rhododendron vialii TaxID=182163 RepID=UPI00265D85D0|nr:uncharacterized protein LOC131314145 [Rhododendron vialii]